MPWEEVVPQYSALLFKVRFMAEVPALGKSIDTCAIEVVPPVIVFEKMLFLQSIPVSDVELINKHAEDKELAAVPGKVPNKLTVL